MKAGSGTGRRASFKERYSLYVNRNPRRKKERGCIEKEKSAVL